MEMTHEPTDGAYWIKNAYRAAFVPRKEYREDYRSFNIMKARLQHEITELVPGLWMRFQPHKPTRYENDPMYIAPGIAMELKLVHEGYVVSCIGLSNNMIKLMSSNDLKRTVLKHIIDNMHKIEKHRADRKRREESTAAYEAAYQLDEYQMELI